MLKRIGTLGGCAMLAVALLVGAVGCSGGDVTVDNAGGRDAADPAKSLVDSKCAMCHTLDRVYTVTKTKAEWEATLDRMKTNGLVVTDAEYASILEYLSR